MARNPVVLVVDDEENLAYVLNSALRLNGFEVAPAATGRDALAAVDEHSPDLIVLDVMLPDLDGFEVCRRLRQEPQQHTRAVSTARGDTEDRLRGLTIGGDDYVAKSFSVEELVARVRAILRRAGIVTDEQVLRCGPVSLDDDAHIVCRDGVEAALSPNGVQALAILDAQPGSGAHTCPDSRPRLGLRLRRRINRRRDGVSLPALGGGQPAPDAAQHCRPAALGSEAHGSQHLFSVVMRW